MNGTAALRRSVLPLAIMALMAALLPTATAMAASTNSASSASSASADAAAVRPARGVFQRLSGPDRVATAAQISRATFEPDVPLALIATAQAFPDALTAGPLAASIGAPILLTQPDRLPPGTASELERLRPARIMILGGTEAVSDAVADALAGLTGPAGVDRVWGATRYETAAAIARQAFTPPAGVVFVASGLDFPDALSGAAAGAKLGGPVLLTGANDLPVAARAALDELRPRRIVVLGGTQVVPERIRSELRFYTDAEVERWAGTDRFETSARIAAEAFPAAETTAVFVATGANFPDALTGAGAAGVLNAPLLLTSRFEPPDRLAEELARLAPGGLDVFVLGGEAVVSTQTADELAAYANPTLSRLSGKVTDPVDGTGVREARVALWRSDENTHATSGPTGGFVFEELVWGRFRLEVDRLGYAPKTVADLDVEPGEHRNLDVALTRVTSIAGRVVLAGRDQQIPGARVTARRVVNGDPVGPTYETVADLDGAFVLSEESHGLDPGQYRYEATRDGYKPASSVVPVDGNGWTEFDIELVKDD